MGARIKRDVHEYKSCARSTELDNNPFIIRRQSIARRYYRPRTSAADSCNHRNILSTECCARRGQWLAANYKP